MHQDEDENENKNKRVMQKFLHKSQGLNLCHFKSF